ncbi:aminoacyl-tRNA deacylase [Paenibacillus sp. UNC451MF]|uniref:aminoacyl-tRNA deacylase n=1 Tax=Paenibacillus sp. UNC451MF TaxID=1449063 RepID=UPI0004905C44|nr:YbaK/EbsC family protein [Paenibacillus sp. UNC451MF]
MDELICLLEEHQISYEIIDHKEPIRSAQDGAAFFGIEIGQTAPTLILKSGTTMYAFIISGDYGKIDFDVIKELLQCEELKLAKPREVEEATGYSVGSVPLIGHGLPTIIDRRLHRYPYVYGGTGAATSTLRIGPQDIEKLNHVIAYDR